MSIMKRILDERDKGVNVEVQYRTYLGLTGPVKPDNQQSLFNEDDFDDTLLAAASDDDRLDQC